MKYWKALMAATLLLGLSACGGGDDSDKNDPPPPTPGDAGSVVISAKAPDFVLVKDPADPTKEVEKLAVEFTLKDAQGNPIDIDVDSTALSFSVTKLIPGRVVNNVEGPSIWKAFIYKDAKATFEKSLVEDPEKDKIIGTLEPLGNGNYRYLFATYFKNVLDPYPSDSVDHGGLIAWDDDKLHRLSVTFGSAEEGSTMPLINYTLDWVPSGATAALTRDILEMESCSDCHMDQPIHHSSRNDPKVCVACHNESNPDNTGRRALTVLVHDFHSAGLTEKGAHYPQDSRNCDTCHKPETPTTQNADSWKVPSEQPCAACHVEEDFTDHHDYDPTTQTCSSCHAEGEEATKSPSAAHMGRMANEVIGRDKIVISFDNVSYVAPNIEVEMSVTVDGTPAESIDDLLKYVKWGYTDPIRPGEPVEPASAPYILVNVDKGEGFELSYSGIGTKETNVIHFPDCIAQGGGKFLCSKAVEGEVSGNLAATVAEMQICVARKKDRNGAFAAGDLLTCDSTASALSYIAIQPTKHYAHATGGEDSDYLLKAGADMAACDGCHKDLSFHIKGGNGFEHAAKDFAQCTSCHNAVKTAYYPGEAGDLKNIVHRYHAMGSGHGGGSTFPGKVNNCESCHDKAQYNLPNQENARPSKVLAFDSAGKQLGNKYYSPTLVACASCHLQSPLGKVNVSAPAAGDEWASHMQENGAVFGAATAEEATGREECASCHAIGQDQGVDKVHNVFEFR